MKLKLTVDISGSRNGLPWPPRGEVVDLPEPEARDMIAAGQGEAVAAKAAKAPAPTPEPDPTPEPEAPDARAQARAALTPTRKARSPRAK